MLQRFLKLPFKGFFAAQCFRGEGQRGNARSFRPLQRVGVRLIGDRQRDLGASDHLAPCVQDRLQIRSAAGYQNRDADLAVQHSSILRSPRTISPRT